MTPAFTGMTALPSRGYGLTAAQKQQPSIPAVCNAAQPEATTIITQSIASNGGVLLDQRR
jgi:hypothetical protein